MLSVANLSIGYGQRVVGAGMSFDVVAGEVLALLGPNGGGKTTLLKTVLGLIAPLEGRVALDGRDIARVPLPERARTVGYVPQAAASPFPFSVEDVVLMGRTAHAGVFAKPSARDRQVAAAALERLGIAHLADRPSTMISGGERQLVLVARALAQEPRIVILDEPTASLDLGNQGKVMREIRALAESGLAVLFTTHDPNHALRVADRALLLRDGRIVAAGAVSEAIVRERLEDLYRAPVDVIDGPAGRAFLPGLS